MGLETAALVSIGSAALGSGMSFAQAGKQRKLQQQAEIAAQKAFDEAKSKLDVNYLEGLSIAKEPFELEREALAQAQQRAAMAREQQRLNEMVAQEESRLQGAKVDLDLGEAIGQQQRAQQAQQMGASAMNQAIGGMFDIAAAGFEGADLFSGREGLQLAKQFTRQQNPTRRTRRLGNANIQTVSQIDPMLISQPGLFAPIFTD